MPGTETNYTPTPYGTYTPPAVVCIHGNCVGNGVPSNDFGYDGFSYVDEDTSELYLKSNGIWVIHTGGGGGGGAGLTYHQGAFLDPNGNVNGSVGDLYYSRLDLGGDGSLWPKRAGSGTTTGWGG